MVDPGSSLNIMSLLILEAVGIQREHVVKQPIEIFSFGGDMSLKLGYFNVDVAIVLT